MSPKVRTHYHPVGQVFHRIVIDHGPMPEDGVPADLGKTSARLAAERCAEDCFPRGLNTEVFPPRQSEIDGVTYLAQVVYVTPRVAPVAGRAARR